MSFNSAVDLAPDLDYCIQHQSSIQWMIIYNFQLCFGLLCRSFILSFISNEPALKVDVLSLQLLFPYYSRSYFSMWSNPSLGCRPDTSPNMIYLVHLFLITIPLLSMEVLSMFLPTLPFIYSSQFLNCKPIPPIIERFIIHLITIKQTAKHASRYFAIYSYSFHLLYLFHFKTFLPLLYWKEQEKQ